MMSTDLERAYRGTEYRVFYADGDFVLRIGEHSPELDALLHSFSETHWAYITPCNPRSAPLTDSDNANRLAQFRTENEIAYRLITGAGVGISRDWPPELSILVIGIDRSAALSLATRWEQNAFVYGERGGVAELAWCPTICGENGR